MVPAWVLTASFLGIALLLLGICHCISRRPSCRGADELLILLPAIAIWAASTGLDVLTANFETKLLLVKVAYLGVIIIGPACIAVALAASGSRAHMRPGMLALLVIPGLVEYGFILNLENHTLLWRAVSVDTSGAYPLLQETPGVLFWTIAGWALLQVFVALVLHVARWSRNWSYYRGEAVPVTMSVMVPVAFSLYYLSQSQGPAMLDFTPLTFGVTAASLAWALVWRDGVFKKVRFVSEEILDDMADGVLVADLVGNLIYMNRAARRNLAIAEVPLPIACEVALEDYPELNTFLAGASLGPLELGLSCGRENRIYDLQATPLTETDGSVSSRVLVMRDITERKHTEGQVRAGEDGLRQIIDLLPHLIYAKDADGRFLMANRAGAAVYRMRPDQLVGRRLQDLRVRTDTVERILREDRAVLESGEDYYHEDSFTEGENQHYFQTTKIPFSFPATGAPAVLGISINVTERLQADAKIRALAFYDSLTGLPNRRRFQRFLAHSLASARRQGHRGSLLFLDIDRFKEVNDRLGHVAGDQLLCEVAKRLRESVRFDDELAFSGELDDPDSHPVCRLAGDEFTILLTNVSDALNAGQVASRIVRSMSEPFQLGLDEIFSSVSIGIAAYPEDGADSETLLRCADKAMYKAKEAGRNRYAFFDASMSGLSERRHAIELRLRQALEFDKLRLEYQPIRRANTGELSGVEALLRWSDGELGEVGPEEIVAVAEESGMIHSLGLWVMRRACQDQRALLNEGFAGIRMSINVSAYQLQRPEFADEVIEVTNTAGISADTIELELTETAILANDTQTDRSLRALSDFGIRLALDDFGTGQSSLSYLRRFAFSRIKIDRSFVTEIPGNWADASLTAAIIAMAHGLGLSVVAEGVESEAQVDFLCKHGCDELQGFLFSRAISRDQLSLLLRKEKTEERED